MEDENFGQRYYVILEENGKKIKVYILNQLKEDELGEQLSFDVGTPFKG